MSHITFRRVTPELSRIYDGDGCVGEVCRQPEILNCGRHCYVITMNEDPRGPLRVFDRSRIRDEARVRLLTHPFY